MLYDFFICNTFISNARLKLAKNQANAKQHPEPVILLFENYWHFSSMLLTKSNRAYSKNKQKHKCACIHGIILLILMKMKTKMKNGSHRYDLNRPKLKYSKYKKCLNMMLLICMKQHLNNIWISVHEKVKQHKNIFRASLHCSTCQYGALWS